MFGKICFDQLTEQEDEASTPPPASGPGALDEWLPLLEPEWLPPLDDVPPPLLDDVPPLDDPPVSLLEDPPVSLLDDSPVSLLELSELCEGIGKSFPSKPSGGP
jgi:hypothetical protein